MAEGENTDLQKQLELLKRIDALETIAKQYMTGEAISRYYTLKSAHPELAIRTITIIAQAVQQKQFTEKLSDADFKKLLQQFQEPKKQFNIRK